MKAKTTMMVLAKMEDTAIVNTIPNVVCLRRQVADEGRPMKSKEQRKQKLREMRRVWLRARLLALTMGVS